jgi:hypothetical protein
VSSGLSHVMVILSYFISSSILIYITKNLNTFFKHLLDRQYCVYYVHILSPLFCNRWLQQQLKFELWLWVWPMVMMARV